MLTIKVNELPDLILNRLGLILFDDLYDLLHFDKKKAPEVFKTIIKDALSEYSKQYPVQMKAIIDTSDKVYYFEENFDLYLKGRISENQIILRPIAIYFLKNGLNINAQWWDYQINDASLRTRFGYGTTYVEYAAHYPYVLDIAPDNRFTEDSKLYYLDIDHDIIFLDYLIYYTIRQIRLIQGSLNLGTPVTFLQNLDQLFNEFEQIVQTHRDQRSDVLRMWRK